MIPNMLLKLLVPKVLELVIKQFKMDKVLEYVEEPNDADIRIDNLETDVFILQENLKILNKPKRKKKKK